MSCDSFLVHDVTAGAIHRSSRNKAVNARGKESQFGSRTNPVDLAGLSSGRKIAVPVTIDHDRFPPTGLLSAVSSNVELVPVAVANLDPNRVRNLHIALERNACSVAIALIHRDAASGSRSGSEHSQRCASRQQEAEDDHCSQREFTNDFHLRVSSESFNEHAPSERVLNALSSLV